MLRAGLLFILILSIANAVIIGPRVYEQDDFGDISLDEFTYSLSVDCSNATILAIVMNESNKPVQEADTYLKYVDFASPLISTGSTDRNGFVLHELPGNVSLMRGLFILVIEKDGYRSKEVHFDIVGCLTNQSYIPPPPAPQQPPPPPSENATKVSLPVPPPAQNETFNATENITEQNGLEEERYSDVCIPAFLVPLLMLFSCNLFISSNGTASKIPASGVTGDSFE